ncbi:Telomere reverse transcriptase [Penicillium taxi]|uniref:Telomere reverse transcriptase n=1 Tax=Penicillium taxi TaxID=168475 RepID=UPI0025450BB2|nr:Telomere reverse transcriptase [Penicillium taxi]KAJ5902253.1 Telomere reverse transcriptase [Penicillium taxi]
MGSKRKRPVKTHGPTPSSQTSITKTLGRFKSSKGPIVPKNQTSHPLISLYYRNVLTLRQYLLDQLPRSSKLRRRRIASLEASAQSNVKPLATLLDSTLVGVLKKSPPELNSERQRGYLAFSQSQSRSILASTDSGPDSPQSEVVEFVIGQLFNRYGSYQKSPHLLTHGFKRLSRDNGPESIIPGLVAEFPNPNVRTLTEAPWTDILGLLGQNGNDIMMRLLFDCGIFSPINVSKGIYYQLSGRWDLSLYIITTHTLLGLPLSSLEQVRERFSELDGLDLGQKETKKKRDRGDSRGEPYGLNSIVLSRRRILYSRPKVDSNQKEPSGLSRNHVLNRFSSLDSTAEDMYVMKYIFPRQFGLQNVFVRKIDANYYTNPFTAPNFREEKISRQALKRRPVQSAEQSSANTEDPISKCPKRLRGKATELSKSLRVRHARCSYRALLEYYCPMEANVPWTLGAPSSLPDDTTGNELASSTEKLITQASIKGRWQEAKASTPRKSPKSKPKVSMGDYATPPSSVSAFCRSVLQNLIPPRFFGDGVDGIANRKAIMKNVDKFIKMRRYESLSLHELCNGLKITCISWLVSPKLQRQSDDAKDKMSFSDLQKRTELLHEFIFYIFDSLLMDLIRTNFYVTESQVHRYRLFYFRHDVWKRLTEQPLLRLKATMFEELDPESVQRMLASSSLGVGALRLLPKSTGIRPILNLRKRALKQSIYNKKRRYLAPSINSNLAPVYNMLNYERDHSPTKSGAAMQSMGELHPRLKVFKQQLVQRISNIEGSRFPRLFFVKVDIQACFDTIPQKKLLHIIANLVSEEQYLVTKHVEMNLSNSEAWKRPMRKYLGRAAPLRKQQAISEIVANRAHRKDNTVFIDSINQKTHGTDSLIEMLDEHVRNNLVKMGKQYFRQRSGIPQGSVVSSLLCNFFYAELERNVLGFLRPEESLLLRLVDDFLLVTTDIGQATEFLQVMIRGQPSYGVTVNPAKSLVNFTTMVDGVHIPRLEGSSLFPYCGCLIDTHTLGINRDQDRLLDGGDSAAATLSNTLTVETSRLPGRTFQRRVVTALRFQLHSMYIDGAHNSRSVVLSNLYCGFITSAMKMYRYMKSLRGRAHPDSPIIINIIRDLIQQTHGIIQARRASKLAPLSCPVHINQLQYLAAAAFRFVFQRKQTRYAPVLQWLDKSGRESRPTTDAEALRMLHVVKKGTALFKPWRF